jgi:hypothetical protein
MTPSGIEPAAFQLVAQCLIQLRHCLLKWIKLHPLNTLRVLPFVFAVLSQIFFVFEDLAVSSHALKFNEEDTSYDINKALKRQ